MSTRDRFQGSTAAQKYMLDCGYLDSGGIKSPYAVSSPGPRGVGKFERRSIKYSVERACKLRYHNRRNGYIAPETDEVNNYEGPTTVCFVLLNFWIVVSSKFK